MYDIKNTVKNKKEHIESIKSFTKSNSHMKRDQYFKFGKTANYLGLPILSHICGSSIKNIKFDCNSRRYDGANFLRRTYPCLSQPQVTRNKADFKALIPQPKFLRNVMQQLAEEGSKTTL